MARAVVVFVTLLAAAGLARAQQQALSDPTRPPAQLLPHGDARAAAVAGPRLESVILPRGGGRPAAVIDGVRVELGGRIAGARLVAVSEESVVLKGTAGRQVLRLTPQADKRVRAPGRR